MASEGITTSPQFVCPSCPACPECKCNCNPSPVPAPLLLQAQSSGGGKTTTRSFGQTLKNIFLISIVILAALMYFKPDVVRSLIAKQFPQS